MGSERRGSLVGARASFRVLVASAVMLVLLAGGGAARAQTQALVANPYFSEWVGGLPAGWTPTAGASVTESADSYDAVRSGPNAVAVVVGAAQDDGLMQSGIAVNPSSRYDIYAWVRVPGAVGGEDFQLHVSGAQSGEYLVVPAYNTATPAGWHRIQATFTTSAAETSVTIAFLRAGLGGAPLELWVDDVGIWERTPDPSASLVARPAKPVVLYGLEQNIGRMGDADTLATFNVFDSYYQTPAFVSTLRAQGKVAAKRVYVSDVGVEELVARWTEPFRDTMEGRLPQGFDAIIIDEFGGWTDSTTRAATVAEALQKTRALYPARQIYIWGDWTLGRGANHDRVLGAINAYADTFILEAYAHELLPQYELPGMLATTIQQRERANPAVTGLLRKTVFGLASYQTPDSYTGDNSASIDFKSFLEEQFQRIVSHPIAGLTSGIGLFAYQYTPPDTMAWFNALARHYVLQSQRSYLRPVPLVSSPLGRHAAILAERNPSFEIQGAAWVSLGNPASIAYSTVPQVPAYHGATRSPVPHGAALLRMQKAQAQGSAVTQVIPVQPSTAYVFSAYALGTGGAAAEVSVRDARASGAFQQTALFASIPGDAWTKVGVAFTTPADVTAIEVRLSDRPAAPGATTYWDYVELTGKNGVDIFTPTVTAETASLTIDWVTDMPTTSEVQFGITAASGQTVRGSTSPSTRHRVVLTGLTPGTTYRFRTVNRTNSTLPGTTISPEYTLSTRSSTGPVADASPIPPDVVPPDPPTGLAVVPGAGGVTLDWDPNEFDVVGYDVYRSETLGGPLTKVNPALVRDSAYVDVSAPPGVRFFYAVRAVDAAGNESEPGSRVGTLRDQSKIRVPFVAQD